MHRHDMRYASEGPDSLGCHLTPSGYLGIAIAAFGERMYRNDPESDLVQNLRKIGLSIGSADRTASAIEALRRAVIRGSLGVFVWHSGMSAPVKLSDTALARLRMLDRRTLFLRTGHVRTADLAGAGILGKLAKNFSALRCFFEEHAFCIWLDRKERRLRSTTTEILLDRSPLVVRQKLESSNRGL